MRGYAALMVWRAGAGTGWHLHDAGTPGFGVCATMPPGAASANCVNIIVANIERLDKLVMVSSLLYL